VRVAALYDVHGNVRALEAVLREAGDVDAYVFGGDVLWGPWPRETLELVRSLGVRARFLRGNWERFLLEGSDEWTAQHVSPEAVRDWPPTLSVDGALYCHATPVDDDAVVLPQLERSDWSSFAGPLVVCGHTHLQFDVERGATRVVNPGSVGLPTVAAAAWWALVEDGRRVELRRTEYDTAATAAAMRATAFPHADGFADELAAPPTLEQLLEALGG
jgi:predicted phosphodiesterase